jgi:sortase A
MMFVIGFNYFKVCQMTNKEHQLVHTFQEEVINPDTDTFDVNSIHCKENNQTSFECSEKKQTTTYLDENIDCVIRIPSIDLEKLVYTGTSRLSHLESYELITASEDMRYVNGGNYIICGHASRIYGHSLNRIKELKTGDLIYVDTKNGTETYTVYKISFVNRDKSCEYFFQTDVSTLTIISCARYVSDNSYIVVQAQ